MSAPEACAAAARGLKGARPDWTVEQASLTDGGEGFASILTAERGGRLTSVKTAGPRFGEIEAVYGTVSSAVLEDDLKEWLEVPPDGAIAVIEMAQASGLQSLAPGQRDPWLTTTLGTGQMIDKTCRGGAKAILLGIGGSATNDLGLGALEALGLRFQGKEGFLERIIPAKWGRVDSLSGEIAPLPPVRIACDVQNPLLGPNGAAAVYGAQKGLRAEDLEHMQKEMERMARLLCAFSGADRAVMNEPGSGAAGGIGFGLRAACGAKYKPGFEMVARWLRLEEKVAEAGIVITGEGRFDESSLQGKGPGALMDLAARHGKPVYVFAGQTAPDLEPVLPFGLDMKNVRAVAPPEYPLERALREGPDLLETAVREALS